MIIRFLQSSIGKKWIVALTGLVLIGYVLGHLAGNLQIFISPKQINAYAHFLHSLGPALWVIRAFLIACFALHIFFTAKLTEENRRATPVKYAVKASVRATTATKTMILSGLIVLAFVIYHLLQFTTRQALSADILSKMTGEYDCYNMVVLGFRNPLTSGFYILALFLLCLHLSHGFSSVLQTLSINNRKLANLLVIAGQALAWLIFAGYISIPVAVIAGILKPIFS